MHEVQLLPILVAGFAPMVLGMLWYGPLFGKRWLALMERTEEEIRRDFNPLKTHGVSFLLALGTAFVLQQLLAASEGGVAAGIHLALLASFGFLLPLGYQGCAYEGRKGGLVALNVAYNSLALMGQAAVLAVWS